MTQAAVMTIFFVLGVFPKAWASQISGYGNTTADYGGDAYYRCILQNPTGVLQVTWQRLFKDESLQNLATYSKRFGQQVNEPYREKLTFTEASLNSSSMTVRNVTWEDESCYICSFNVYPDGSQRRQTCLTVQGISEVKTDVQVTDRGKEEKDVKVVFSCSATGKPAPSIQWVVSPPATSSEETKTMTATNSDHTFTSSRNITLKVSADWNGDVDCLVNSGKRGQRLQRIPFSLHPEHVEDKKAEELHEPILQIRESKSPEETVVSCSATGRPAPTVTLNVPQQDLYFSHNSTVSVTNTNGTVTVTTTAVLSGFHGNGAQVGCAARLLSVPEIQVFKTIPAVKRSSTDDSTVIIVFVVLACGCVAAVIAVLLKRKYNNSLSHRDSEMNEMNRSNN